ncbi:hypothetical protein yberc0001_19170 [Yersinia bercovieri ATCC 43970]|uniref:Uncharacterized protein n=1 Tax=Yersinia bercovieri ATCC 43970 TaxID=349968 RepID=A0ABM9XV36_YERBE|nr:hypothetical protein yberc0001_19170 [Yersinia bercovieri ATCC 43970]
MCFDDTNHQLMSLLNELANVILLPHFMRLIGAILLKS